MKALTGRPTGRPYIAAYDSVQKDCEFCGRAFFLREQKYQSFAKFQKRRFCSVECYNSTISTQETAEWIMSRVTKVGNGCWVWNGSKTLKGYGRTNFQGRKSHAHRVSYKIFHGPIPEGLVIMHSCDNPPCCNPAHLSAGTHRDNVHDAIAKGRAWHCRKAKS